MVGLSRVYLSNLVSMSLLIKAMELKQTLVIISSMVFFVVQTLENVRTRCTSSSSLSRRVRLGISLVTPNQESVVLHSV